MATISIPQEKRKLSKLRPTKSWFLVVSIVKFFVLEILDKGVDTIVSIKY